MRGIKDIFLAVMVFLIFFSCTDSHKSIKFTLIQAGDNKPELEKILSYYTNPEDSLKRKAAYFLIQNMSAYFCLSSADLEKFNDELFGAIRGKTDNYATNYNVFILAIDSIAQTTGFGPPFHNLSRKYDSQNVTADFLIENIDCAFDAWKNNSWTKNVSFEDFCSYILPYRAASEPLGINRAELHSKYTKIVHGCENVTDPNTVFNYITNQYFFKYHRLFENRYPYLMSMENSEILGIGSCVHSAIYYTMLFRSIGLPVAIDYTPHWGNYNGSHYMAKLIASDSMPALPTNNNSDNTAENSRFEMSFNSGFTIPQDSLPYGFSIQYIKTIPKIYRKTGMIQPDRQYLLSDPYADETGMFSDACDKDVTDEYMECSDITIKVGSENRDKKIAYLCVFSEGEWIPVCASPMNNDKVTFSKMGRMIVYLAIIYDHGKMKPVSRPFYFTEKGNTVTVEPKNQRTLTIKLVSKYPLFSYAARHSYNMRSGRFEGANSRDFRDAETFYEIDHYPLYYQDIKINSEKVFRYYRYTSREYVTYGFAELEFFTTDRSDTIPLNGHFFDEFYSDAEYFKNLSDKDLNTNVTGVPRKESWIGFDTGERTRLAKIRFAPVNDANCIIAGQEYELFYWDNGGWVSLGRQIASSDYLVYDNAPHNALFWLRCHSQGKEERIFTWENGKQKWW